MDEKDNKNTCSDNTSEDLKNSENCEKKKGTRPGRKKRCASAFDNISSAGKNAKTAQRAIKRITSQPTTMDEIRKILNSDISDCSDPSITYTPDFTSDFFSAINHDLGILGDSDFDGYAQLVLNSDLKICYINCMVQKLLRGIKCGELIDNYAHIDDFSRATNVIFPFQTLLRCEKGVFMCMIFKIFTNRQDYYNVSIAYSSEKGELGLHSFLCSKLAIINLQSIAAKRSHNFRRTDKQVKYITSFFDYQAKKAMMIKSLMCSNAVLLSKKETERTEDFLTDIADRYCKAMDFMQNNLTERNCKKDEKTEKRVIVDCDPADYIYIDPIFTMAVVYLTDAMFSISGTGYITLGLEKFGVDNIVTFKTNVGTKTYNSINSLSENLTDKSESPFFKIFFREVISKYAPQPPEIITNKSEVMVRLFLPKKTNEYILRSSLSTTRRFCYLKDMFASIGLGDLDFKIYTFPNAPSEEETKPE